MKNIRLVLIGETSITILAKDWSNRLRSMSTSDFDPLA